MLHLRLLPLYEVVAAPDAFCCYCVVSSMLQMSGIEHLWNRSQDVLQATPLFDFASNSLVVGPTSYSKKSFDKRLLWQDGSSWVDGVCSLKELTMAPVQGGKEVHCCAQQVQLTTRTKLFYHYQNRRRLFTCAVAMRRGEFWLHWRSSSCYVNTIMDTAAIIKKWLMTSSLWCGVITHWCNGACHEDFWWLNSVDWWYKEARANGVAWVTIVRSITQNWVARLYRFSVLIVPHRVESLKYIVLAS